MILLIGNYALDRQQSMQRFSAMMLEGLTAAGVPAELIEPAPLFGNFWSTGGFVAKWLAYLDKFVLFPRTLRARLAPGGRSSVSLVHICDHSNALYARRCAPVPVVVTCHDLLAVRGALGEATDTPASAMGIRLQRWILSGLRRAQAIACVSRATLADAQRLIGNDAGSLQVVTSGLNYPYRRLPAEEAAKRLVSIAALDPARPFVLHVGSDQKRKNRDGVLRIFARTLTQWDGQLVYAGAPMSAELRSLAREAGAADRIVEVPLPDGALLEALYNRAEALLYPSRFEGFGWPIAEAQACGCPVICSQSGPLPEVAGDAGLLHPVEDEAAFAADILRLTDSAERAHWSEKSLRNAERFSTARMIAQYIHIYRSLAPQL